MKMNLVRNIVLSVATVIVLLAAWSSWNRPRPIQGEMEEIVPISEQISIRYYDFKPINVSVTEFSEIRMDGAWLKMNDPDGRLYILRILPECRHEGDEYFFVNTNGRQNVIRERDRLEGEATRGARTFNMYLKYQDDSQLDDINRIFVTSPMKYEVTGEKVSKRAVLSDNSVSDREKFVIRNLPSGSQIVNVSKLTKIHGFNTNAGFWESDLARLLPWLILLLLLALMFLNWGRLFTMNKGKPMVNNNNLEEFGYVSAGQSGGDPIQFRSYLNSIYKGDLSNDHGTEMTDNQIDRIKAKINDLTKGIEHRKSEIDELKKGENLPMFDPVRFWIALFIFIGLTVFSYFFYLSTINKALYVAFDNCDAAKLNILPSQAELSQAVQNSWIIVIVPFTVFALGWILHMVIDSPTLKRGQRFLYLTLILSVTLFLDFLLASFIHKNMSTLKEYCGFGTDEVWYESTTFYIIIFLGFMVYIFWSMILYYLLQQIEKRSKKRMIHTRSEKLRQEIQALSRASDRQIEILENGVGNVSGNIDAFHLGWNNFMSTYPHRFGENQQQCELIKNEFMGKMIRQDG